MCGVFGIRSVERDVARLSYFALFALQHRGQESAGIAVSDRGRLTVLRDMGLVAQVFDEEQLQALPGDVAIGHTRYSTTGSTLWANAQPLVQHGAARSGAARSGPPARARPPRGRRPPRRGAPGGGRPARGRPAAPARGGGPPGGAAGGRGAWRPRPPSPPPS